MENASHFYTSDRVKQMIERQKTKYGWEFLFLGANIDAVETARHFGIGADRAVNYNSDSAGTQLNYEVLSEAISAVRCSAPLGADWKRRIDEDYEKRGKGRKNKSDEHGKGTLSSVFFLCIPPKRPKNVRCKVKGIFTGRSTGNTILRE